MRRYLLGLLAAVCMAFAVPAYATVNSSTNRAVALGNGSQTQFTFSFIGVAANYISVILTDSSGNETVLTQGSGTTQYQIVLNSPVQGAIWGLGGTITYNPSGSPIPAGSTLTIYRTLPLTQAITLSNLTSVSTLGKGAETGLDTGVMQGQQINEQVSRAIVANITNSAPPLPLPPAAQLAGLGLCGDSSGLNIIGCSLAPSGIISSAMQPVVSAATLAAGRLAFGLGSMAVENINGGTCGGSTIQDDGSAGGTNGVGYARVVFTPVSDATNQSVTCAYHLNQRIATGPITYTLPRANTLFAGFGFTVYVSSGLITFAPNANDNFPGVSSGSSVSVAAGSVCTINTNAASSGVWQLNCNNSPPSLSSSSNGSALTLTLNGALLNFRDPTLAQGDPLWAIPTGGLSITIPSGATLGTSNGVSFRGWVFAAYNSGRPVLGVATCSNAASIFGCSSWETIRKSGTAITSGSTSAGTLYTTSGVTNDAIRIVGYFEYTAGLASAGVYNIVPTTLQLCIASFVCKRPGDIVQTVRSQTGTFATGTTTVPSDNSIPQNTEGDQYMSLAITPTASPNVLIITWRSYFANSGGGTLAASLFQDSAANALATSAFSPVANTIFVPGGEYSMIGGTTSSTTFKIRAGSSVGGTTTFNGTGGAQFYGGVLNSYILINEVMGSLSEPANDDCSTQMKAVG